MSASHPPESPSSSDSHLPHNFIFLPATTLLVVMILFGLQAALTPGVPTSGHGHDHAATEHGDALSSDLSDNDHRQQKMAQAPTPKTADQLPVIAQLPDFAFIERQGKTVASQDIQGKVWIADFIFTSCQAECPLMNVEMQKIQRAFPDGDVKMLSFSVDPETDTPQRLTDYANQFEAGDHWLFFTGEREALHQFAINDFKLSVQPLDTDPSHEHHGGHAPAAEGTSPFLHSQKFVLLDQQQRIRGYYDSTDPTDIKQLIEVDIPALLAAAS
jgi:protein SCO1